MAEDARAHAAPAGEAPPGPTAWQAALLESRQRWRDFAVLAADLAFETDAEGRLTFLSPDSPLGWPAEALLGRRGRDLLTAPEPDPFALRHPVRDLRVWLRRPGGGSACLSLSLAPLHDPTGVFLGLRGCGRDITDDALAAEAQAAALRRAEALQGMVRRVRRPVLAPQMLEATLEALESALGCAGAAILDWPPGGGCAVLHRRGQDPAAVLPAIEPHAGLAGPAFLATPGGESVALLPQAPRGGGRQALLAWRAAGLRSFDEDDRHLLLAMADLLSVVLGNQAMLERLERLALTDPLTGLSNRRAFLEALERRLRRHALDAAQPPAQPGRRGAEAGGALVFLDLDNFKPINDCLGHEAGDAALVAVADLLRGMIRPADLVARFGGDEFALWLDGADAAAGAQRAAALLTAAPGLVKDLRVDLPLLSFSIGCAVWQPDGAEAPEALLARADAAMYEAKRTGRGRWMLAPPDPMPPGAP
ncbi:sensor domain-containing diguanylate cyclase [Paracraurococcus ruber]|uniref:diguanylate cyclase n=2 Tax=Paracraurococcus ruber TaxID=77675 RepID=A0ABS1CTX2_9PROT|nr:sensor domain-containing diguanylate cyclase [Paracraurococcus ruber]MBK1657850.1 hypothetical protein [Paracraurococcus ruber]TDG33533.1 diguanylate cyclase [Paracraurococcus ruber]